MSITTIPIKKIDFPDSQYVKEKYNKKQIVIHHTVSGDNVYSIASWWKHDKPRIATSIIIDRKGTPYQLFSTNYWGYHLGIKKKVFNIYNIKYTRLDKYSIGVELTNWGGLTEHSDGKLYTVYGNTVPKSQTVYYEKGFRGFNWFQKYTNEQIKTLKELILYWNKHWNIDLTYNEDMWDVSKDALKGKNGVWTHVSFRKDKSDCHPQKELIDMLETLL